MNRVFQIISAELGQRTVPFISTREEMAKILFRDGEYAEGVTAQDVVLCLGDLNDEGVLEIGQAPIMRVDNFCNHYGVPSHV